jgi:hypothetical protein
MRMLFVLFMMPFAFAHVGVEAAQLTEEQVNGARIGMTYEEVRARLFELGFAAATLSKDKSRCGVRKQICKDFPEVEACAGTGEAPCRFSLQYPRGRKIIVITKGENPVVTDIFEDR